MKKAISKLTVITLLMSVFAFIGCGDDTDDSLINVTSIRVANATDGVISLIQEDKKQVEVALYPDNAVDKGDYTFKYSSSDESIFTVDENGVITAIGAGEAALRVDAVNNTDMWTIAIVSVEERIRPVTSIYIPEEFRIHYVTEGQTFDLGALVVVNPENATNPEVIFISGNEDLVTVTDRGIVHVRDRGLGNVTITVRATDGSGVEAQSELRIRNRAFTNLDRTGWTATVSEAHTPVNIINGTMTDPFGGFPHMMIDGININQGVIIVKPNATFAGITGGAHNAYFVVDMGSNQDFSFVALRHRTNNTSANLRISAIAVWGSNDGDNFVEILDNAPIATAAAIQQVIVDLPETFNYRYIKIEITGWLPPPAGNTIQVSDFNVGLSSFEPL